jgi:hypothetical protein
VTDTPDRYIALILLVLCICTSIRASNATFILVPYVPLYEMFRSYVAIIRYTKILPKLFNIYVDLFARERDFNSEIIYLCNSLKQFIKNMFTKMVGPAELCVLKSVLVCGYYTRI